MNTPRYPIFIPSKGRWDTRYTVRSFDNIGLPYTVVVEPQEYDHYAAVIDSSKLLVTPHSNMGSVVPTRNFIWKYSREKGHQKHWTFDDNIGTNLKAHGTVGIFRLFRNLKIPLMSGVALRIIEDFADRYQNITIAGMNYFMFASRKTKVPPIYLNKRVYSNMLLDNWAVDPKTGQPWENEGKMNEDTDLNLRVLKANQCTALFNALLIYKRTTMTDGGGHDYFRSEEKEKDSRYIASKEIRDKHPDVTTITKKFGRWHHHVDYSPWAKNKLHPTGSSFDSGINNYGMKLQHLVDGKWIDGSGDPIEFERTLAKSKIAVEG